ncbi:hypothetical protein B0T17DRAFT_46093 [Bombardia bombarda]|uniref:Uncharacterized protein n=1 Tax=Bombardia bombarda TaxID=252184 RepID=A0AA39XLI7_9PEZI|nr:hypothetical protein B0T17DRAFT_46093 [Bombardia bombarda]
MATCSTVGQDDTISSRSLLTCEVRRHCSTEHLKNQAIGGGRGDPITACNGCRMGCGDAAIIGSWKGRDGSACPREVFVCGACPIAREKCFFLHSLGGRVCGSSGRAYEYHPFVVAVVVVCCRAEGFGGDDLREGWLASLAWLARPAKLAKINAGPVERSTQRSVHPLISNADSVRHHFIDHLNKLPAVFLNPKHLLPTARHTLGRDSAGEAHWHQFC